MIRRALLGTYFAAALALGAVYGWEWWAIVLFLGVMPGLALAYLLDRGGEWVRNSAGRLYDEDQRRHARFWAS